MDYDAVSEIQLLYKIWKALFFFNLVCIPWCSVNMAIVSSSSSWTSSIFFPYLILIYLKSSSRSISIVFIQILFLSLMTKCALDYQLPPPPPVPPQKHHPLFFAKAAPKPVNCLSSPFLSNSSPYIVFFLNPPKIKNFSEPPLLKNFYP